MKLNFSIIIPVFNRPQEIDELLESLTQQSYNKPFEVIVVEDGSTEKADEIVLKYQNSLHLKYHYKPNTGAGDSRNVGMSLVTGNYFIVFDSDCIIPPHYLSTVETALQQHFTHAFGGADAAHKSFTNIQKAINYSMTSFLTTGGIRGSKKSVDKFQPRSFNFGISKEAFEKTGGFNTMKIGEDIDLTFRLWAQNFETQFIENAFVYHKRRATFKQFFKQTFVFGKARPGINEKYPATAKITYWFPSIFIISFIIAILFSFLKIIIFLVCYAIYFTLLFFDSYLKNKKISVAALSIVSTIIQFTGYGLGFLRGIINRFFI